MQTSDNYKIRRAIVSVSNKDGIIDFVKALTTLGIEIYSTGGTAKLLIESGIEAKSISSLTGFPEIMDGRVKTLHPAVHAGLLAVLDDENHVNQLKELNLQSIDLLVVNLYPFEETLSKTESTHENIIENIDIGGPSMLRSAAKNYKWTLPVCNPANYSKIIELLKLKDCCIPEEYRMKLAAETFTHTAYYDSVISKYFREKAQIDTPDKFALQMKVEQKLRYGENPHQNAVLYGEISKIHNKLHGKELSYNNIIDIDAATKLILEFEEPTVVIVKHTNPCGVATAETLAKAWSKAYSTDNVSPYGGIIAVNRELDLETANAIHSIFTEVIIAPKFTNEALELLTKKKDRRLIQCNYQLLKVNIKKDMKSVAGGILVQDTDNKLIDEENIKTVSLRPPTDREMRAMMFAWKIAKHVKSNSIVYAFEDRTLGIGAGQMSRVDSSRIATEKAKLMGLSLEGCAVASDAYLPFADGLLEAVKVGATCLIQPGGSVRDADVIKAANENNIAMIFTGLRHFRH